MKNNFKVVLAVALSSIFLKSCNKEEEKDNVLKIPFGAFLSLSPYSIEGISQITGDTVWLPSGFNVIKPLAIWASGLDAQPEVILTPNGPFSCLFPRLSPSSIYQLTNNLEKIVEINPERTRVSGSITVDPLTNVSDINRLIRMGATIVTR